MKKITLTEVVPYQLDEIAFRLTLPAQVIETVHKTALRKIAENLGADVGEKDAVRKSSLQALRVRRDKTTKREAANGKAPKQSSRKRRHWRELNPDRPKNDPCKYDIEFRLRCVNAILDGESLISVADRTGVDTNTLRRWEKKYQLHGRCGLNFSAVHNPRDSYNQETRQNCILAVIKGMSLSEASRTFGVGKTTVHRWMKIHRKGSPQAAIVDN